MARGVPDEGIYQPEVNAQDVLPRKIIPREEPGPIAGAIENLGENLNRKAQADAATYAGDQLADFRVRQIASLENAKANAPTGDPGNFTEQVLQGFDKDAGALAQGAGTNTINNTGTTYIGGNLVVSGALSATGFLAPQAYNNTAAQTVTSSNALVNATGLVTPSNLVAGGRYLCQLRLLFSSATTINCGYKIALAYGGTFTTPPVAAGVGSQNGTGTGQASYNLSVLPISANQVAIGAQWDLSSIDVTFQAATAGILQVQFSQDVATSSTLSLQPGSLMILTRTG